MSQLLELLNSPTVRIILSVSLLTAANVGLVLSLVRNQALLRRSQKFIVNLKNHIDEELKPHMAGQQKLEEKVAIMERRLKDYDERFAQKEAVIENLSHELYSSVQSAKETAAMFLAGFKKELMHGVEIVEDLEARFTTVDVMGSPPAQRETTSPFVAERGSEEQHAEQTTPETPARREQYREKNTPQKNYPESKLKLATAGSY